ncbi:MAG: glycosyltransferase [Proteobacteria bacterium]|nr:glycosyltransferase [Pseudomonadota bacterium]
MRILRVIPTIDPKSGGPAEAARRLDSELLRLGHQVEVASLDAPDTNFAAGYPAAVHPMGDGRAGYRYSRRLLPWLKANAARFDAVVVDGLWQYHGLATWRALARGAVPYFVFTHGMLDPWFKRAYPLKHLKKWLYWPWAEYRVLRDARAVLFTCEEERRLARESFWLYRPRQEWVTAFGTADVPPDSGNLRQAFHAQFPGLADKRLLLFLGRIQEKKGCDLLIEAFAELARDDQRLHLVMAGPGEEAWLAQLRQLAHKAGTSDRITWTGMLTGDLKWGAFYAAELFCLPSHQENFGIAVAEALACGRPVAISDKVNIWREIADDGAGWVGNDTVEGTLGALRQWFQASDDERKRASLAARQSFEKRFRIDAAAAHLASLIGSQLDSTEVPASRLMGVTP